MEEIPSLSRPKGISIKDVRIEFHKTSLGGYLGDSEDVARVSDPPCSGRVVFSAVICNGSQESTLAFLASVVDREAHNDGVKRRRVCRIWAEMATRMTTYIGEILELIELQRGNILERIMRCVRGEIVHPRRYKCQTKHAVCHPRVSQKSPSSLPPSNPLLLLGAPFNRKCVVWPKRERGAAVVSGGRPTV